VETGKNLFPDENRANGGAQVCHEKQIGRLLGFFANFTRGTRLFRTTTIPQKKFAPRFILGILSLTNHGKLRNGIGTEIQLGGTPGNLCLDVGGRSPRGGAWPRQPQKLLRPVASSVGATIHKFVEKNVRERDAVVNFSNDHGGRRANAFRFHHTRTLVQGRKGKCQKGANGALGNAKVEFRANKKVPRKLSKDSDRQISIWMMIKTGFGQALRIWRFSVPGMGENSPSLRRSTGNSECRLCPVFGQNRIFR